MNLEQIKTAAAAYGLDIYGALHPSEGDMSQAKTLVLLGHGHDFWDHFSRSPQYLDQIADPIDTWSEITISQLANTLNARAIFPFGGPPYAPFLSWALASGRAWSSPVGMMVHDTTGLMVSYRGALAFDETLKLEKITTNIPCDTCTDKPCLTTCPVQALSPDGYDVATCRTYLKNTQNARCMTSGCIARRSCPISAGAHQPEMQSTLHMQSFLGKNK